MRCTKRIFDIIFSLFGLVGLSPFLFIIAIIIKLSDHGSVFYRQERIGLFGDTFRIFKFRTMVKDAEHAGGQITIGRDPRITKVGHFLRKYKLDELPQLLNVLVGDMTFVGPRPEVYKYVSLYNTEQVKVLRFVPGITDPASIQYRNENEILALSKDPENTYIQEIMPHKIRINLAYHARANILSDIVVIMKTVFPSIPVYSDYIALPRAENEKNGGMSE